MSTRHRPRHALPRNHRGAKIAAAAVAGLVVTLVVVLFVGYQHLEGNITAVDTTEALGTDRPEIAEVDTGPHEPLNILLLGSDTREGLGNNIGGETPGLSDTTILLHLSADRERAYGISLPRDAMVERPSCLGKDGETTDPGGLSMFNAAYAVGGPACTQRTVEQLTGIRIDHFVVVDFNGFKNMVDALNGVPVCVPTEVNDEIGHITLPAGSYEVTGSQALDYVRVRHGISENGDIGRMKRQQAFLAAMANKAVSAGTLTNPVRLYSFLDAATKSLTTDPELASLKNLASLAAQLENIGLDKIAFLTVPFESYEPDPNRLVWAPEANRLWKRIKMDKPLTTDDSQVITAAEGVTSTPKEPSSPGASPSDSPSGSPSASAEAAKKAAQARENGLCA